MTFLASAGPWIIGTLVCPMVGRAAPIAGSTTQVYVCLIRGTRDNSLTTRGSRIMTAGSRSQVVVASMGMLLFVFLPINVHTPCLLLPSLKGCRRVLETVDGAEYIWIKTVCEYFNQSDSTYHSPTYSVWSPSIP